MIIKHICLSGGGIVCLPMHGTLKRLNQLKFWEHKNIESIYSCSIGTLLGLLIILDLDWDWIDDYLIKRPWKNIFEIDNIDYIKYISEKGILDENTWYKIITPLLKCKNISPDITMLELYNLTNIKFNIYSTKMIGIEPKIINHETEPNMKVQLAISISTCIPGLSKPIFYNNNFLMDGGLLNNNPINDCFKHNDPNEILNICNDTCKDKFEIDNDYTIDYNLNKYIYNDTSNSTLEIDTSNSTLEIDTSNSTLEIDTSNSTLEIDTTNTTLEIDISNCENINSVDSKINTVENNIDISCNIIEYTGLLIKNLVKHIITIHCKNEITIENKISVGIGIEIIDIESWFNILFNTKNIEKYINFGCLQAEKFYIKKYNIKLDS